MVFLWKKVIASKNDQEDSVAVGLWSSFSKALARGPRGDRDTAREVRETIAPRRSVIHRRFFRV
jgi:hypothetical protein